jgi:hypothetical protein
MEGSRARASVSNKEKGKTILNGWKKATPWQDTENKLPWQKSCPFFKILYN